MGQSKQITYNLTLTITHKATGGPGGINLDIYIKGLEGALGNALTNILICNMSMVVVYRKKCTEFP